MRFVVLDRKQKSRCLIFLLISLFTVSAFTRASPNSDFYTGTGQSENIEDARKMAETQLLNQIQVSISHSSSDERTDIDDDQILSQFTSEHKSFSYMQFRGLQYDEQKSNGEYHVLVKVHTDSVRKSLDLRKTKIREYLKSGVTASRQGRISEALRNYYWGYLLSRAYLDTIRIDNEEIGSKKYPSVAFSDLIKHTISHLDIEPVEYYLEDDVITTVLNCRYKERPARDVIFCYYDGLGNSFGASLDDGMAYLSLYDMPETDKRALHLNIEYIHKHEMGSDPEVKELSTIFSDAKFPNFKSVKLNFPWADEPTNARLQHRKPPTKHVKEKLEKSRNSNSDQRVPELTASEVIEVLCQQASMQDFLEILDQYRELGSLTYDKEVVERENWYVAIADKQKVIDILFFNGDRYKAWKTSNEYEKLGSDFKGKYQIWFKTETKK